ncbi:MAG: DUF5518 domain-containing protein [Euryarchaeota archaeon]|nr:DUF5518 domain-containing protein [Euryarchaeota archaeon]MBU4547430.1 DUF5518 domain-containing protein [Euryarchaeota archaeon]MBU4607193.1 DUF5518 domain-containing protein [Euryarchaeota archaeon]MBV1729482.1 DUF5518 domain-containing protein [Methanobacterium sp.]MBV1755223.1 DUF5518 domain-containing protein [Methanobacterium sp.]
MSDIKAILAGGLFTSALTLALGLSIFPLFFLGPLAGGYITIYLTKKYEMDGAKDGALSGLFGGVVISLISFAGIGILSTLIGLISTNLGDIASLIGILAGILFTAIILIMFTVLGALGGVLAENMREKEY